MSSSRKLLGAVVGIPAEYFPDREESKVESAMILGTVTDACDTWIQVYSPIHGFSEAVSVYEQKLTLFKPNEIYSDPNYRRFRKLPLPEQAWMRQRRRAARPPKRDSKSNFAMVPKPEVYYPSWASRHFVEPGSLGPLNRETQVEVTDKAVDDG